MEARLMPGRLRTRRVMVTNIPAGASDEQILDVALDKANETEARLFGWKVQRYEYGRRTTFAVVVLHTD